MHLLGEEIPPERHTFVHFADGANMVATGSAPGALFSTTVQEEEDVNVPSESEDTCPGLRSYALTTSTLNATSPPRPGADDNDEDGESSAISGRSSPSRSVLRRLERRYHDSPRGGNMPRKNTFVHFDLKEPSSRPVASASTAPATLGPGADEASGGAECRGEVLSDEEQEDEVAHLRSYAWPSISSYASPDRRRRRISWRSSSDEARAADAKDPQQVAAPSFCMDDGMPGSTYEVSPSGTLLRLLERRCPESGGWRAVVPQKNTFVHFDEWTDSGSPMAAATATAPCQLWFESPERNHPSSGSRSTCEVTPARTATPTEVARLPLTTQQWPQKNGFVHFDDSSPLFVNASKTGPPLLQSSWDDKEVLVGVPNFRKFGEQCEDGSVVSSTTSCGSADSSLSDDVGPGGVEDIVIVSRGEALNRGGFSMQEEEATVAHACRLSELLACQRQSLPGLGSQLHSRGCCVPCLMQARFHAGKASEPCRFGALCNRCHEPHQEEELQRIQQQMRRVCKNRRKARGRAAAA